MGIAPSHWNPQQYEQFKAERSRPFFDLLALVRPHGKKRLVDLGCGTGELTRELHTRLGAEETLGVDSSESMLEKSAAFAGHGLRFERARIEDFAAKAPLDLVFSNAALHWVEGQEELLTRLASMLRPGGELAVHVPANEDQPSHVVAVEVARESPFAEALGGHVRRSSNLALEDYAALLHRIGFGEQIVRMQVYGNALASSEGVVEWVKGSLLTDYERRMPPGLFTRFVARYRERLVATLGGGEYFYPYKRILFWGARV